MKGSSFRIQAGRARLLTKGSVVRHAADRRLLYLPEYEPVVIIDTDTDPRYPFNVGKFAMFPSYDVGWQYLLNEVHFLIANHPTWTFYEFYAAYAPSSDENDPNAYAEAIAKECTVVPTTILADWLNGVS